MKRTTLAFLVLGITSCTGCAFLDALNRKGPKIIENGAAMIDKGEAMMTKAIEIEAETKKRLDSIWGWLVSSAGGLGVLGWADRRLYHRGDKAAFVAAVKGTGNGV